MKKIVIGVILASTLLVAGPYTKEDRIKDMQQMAHAMNDIQTGFFYNNYDMVSIAVNNLSDAVRRVKPPVEEGEEKDFMKRHMNNMVKMTNKIIKKIDQKSFTLLARFKDKDYAQAMQAYTKIAKKCMECHAEMRRW